MAKKSTDKQRKNTGNIENLKPWKPGQSGNPKGRPPKGLSLTEEIKRQLEEEWLDGKGKSTLEELVRTAIANAMRGNGPFFREIMARVDGIVAQELNVKQTVTINVQKEADRLMDELTRISERQTTAPRIH